MHFPLAAPRLGVVASSYMWCEMMQPVYLEAALCARGFTPREVSRSVFIGPHFVLLLQRAAELDV